MKNGYFKLKRAAAAAAALLVLPCCLAAGETAAVLSGDSAHYLEAYGAFHNAFPGNAELLDASKPGFHLPEDIRYAAAFGAKAAALHYPPGTQLVYALAPVSAPGRHWHQVSLAPAPGPALEAFRGLQPGLRRLAVFWAAYPGEDYLDDLRAAGETFGIEIISARLKSPDSIPERLRRLLGKMDAFWLLPDPGLITESSLRVLASFSCANAVPFYAPTRGLLPAGASASFAPDFRDAGAEAARVLAAIKAGERVPHIVYPGSSRLVVNEALIGKCRWPLKR